jgi:hypothetical protein
VGSGIGRALVVIGLVVAAAGVVVLLGERVGIRLGRLPGDLSFRRDSLRVYVPIATSIVVSVVLTLLLNLLVRRR